MLQENTGRIFYYYATKFHFLLRYNSRYQENHLHVLNARASSSVPRVVYLQSHPTFLHDLLLHLYKLGIAPLFQLRLFGFRLLVVKLEHILATLGIFSGAALEDWAVLAGIVVLQSFFSTGYQLS